MEAHPCGPQLLSVVKLGKPRFMSVGEVVIQAGDISDSMFIVCSGILSCKVSGKEVKRITAGQSFGEMAIYFDHINELFQEHKAILGEAGPLEKM